VTLVPRDCLILKVNAMTMKGEVTMTSSWTANWLHTGYGRRVLSKLGKEEGLAYISVTS